MRPGYRCTINVSQGQKKTIPQMVMCFNMGLALLSSSALVVFTKTVLDEQAVASFTPAAATAVL